MPKYRIGVKRVVYVVVEAQNKDEAADMAAIAITEPEQFAAPETAEELVWCEELPDE